MLLIGNLADISGRVSPDLRRVRCAPSPGPLSGAQLKSADIAHRDGVGAGIARVDWDSAFCAKGSRERRASSCSCRLSSRCCAARATDLEARSQSLRWSHRLREDRVEGHLRCVEVIESSRTRRPANPAADNDESRQRGRQSTPARAASPWREAAPWRGPRCVSSWRAVRWQAVRGTAIRRTSCMPPRRGLEPRFRRSRAPDSTQ